MDRGLRDRWRLVPANDSGFRHHVSKALSVRRELADPTVLGANLHQLIASALRGAFTHSITSAIGQNNADNGMALELVKYLYRGALECSFAQIEGIPPHRHSAVASQQQMTTGNTRHVIREISSTLSASSSYAPCQVLCAPHSVPSTTPRDDRYDDRATVGALVRRSVWGFPCLRTGVDLAIGLKDEPGIPLPWFRSRRCTRFVFTGPCPGAGLLG